MGNRYLFRAKRKKYDSNEEVWVIGSYVHTNDGDYIVVPYKKSTLLGEGKYIEVVPETVCQCTGLKDKNGKLIWENDIVNATDVHSVCVDGIVVNVTDYNLMLNLYYADELECVGNIFDNPELLEGE